LTHRVSFTKKGCGRGHGGPGLWSELLVFLATAPVFGTISLLMRREEA